MGQSSGVQEGISEKIRAMVGAMVGGGFVQSRRWRQAQEGVLPQVVCDWGGGELALQQQGAPVCDATAIGANHTSGCTHPDDVHTAASE